MAKRECGKCSLCCKVLGIIASPPILPAHKHPNRWCQHCAPGRGCKVYDRRPQECVDFQCAWLQNEEWTDDMRPDLVGFVVTGGSSHDGRGVTYQTVQIHVDPTSARLDRRALDALTNELMQFFPVIHVEGARRRIFIAPHHPLYSDDYEIVENGIPEETAHV